MGVVIMVQTDIDQTTLAKPDKEEKGKNQNNRLKNGCLHNTTEKLKYETTSNGINKYIKRMKYHALIRKL
jgi:hypothetical protein